MNPPPAGPGERHISRRQAALVLLALLLLAVVLRGWYILHPPAWDEGVFAYGGREWLRDGVPLYEALFDGKPPVLFLLHGLCVISGLDPFMLSRAVGILVVWLTAWALMVVGTRAHSPRAGIAAAALYVVFVSERGSVGHLILITEPVVALCVAWAVALILAPGRFRAHLAAGALLGIALQTRQTAVLDLLGVLAMVSIVPGPLSVWRKLGGVIAGWAGVCALTVGYFAAQGQLANLWEVGFLGQFAGGYTGEDLNRMDGVRRVESFLRWQGPLLGAAVLGGIAGVRRLPPAFRHALWVWLAFSALSPLAAGPKYPHHLIAVLPALAVLAGLGLCWLGEWWPAQRRTAKVVTVAAALLVSVGFAQVSLSTARTAGGALRRGVLPNEARLLGRHIASTTAPGDRIICIGSGRGQMNAVYIYADRRAPGRFTHHTSLKHPRALPETREAFRRSPPRWIVLDDTFLPPHKLAPGIPPEAFAEFRRDVPALEFIWQYLETQPYHEVNLPGITLFHAYELY